MSDLHTAVIPDGFHGTATALKAEDVDRVAAQLGLEPRLIWAVSSVEANQRGFLPDGRPQLLFEAHQFHLLTAGQFDAAHPNISSPVWDKALYGAAGAHQYDRLAEAMELDRDAALESATWGMFQVLGSNYAQVGFPTIDVFVSAMCEAEGRHLDAFAAYFRANDLVRFLAAHDWQNFALGYNGPGQMRNAYAARLMVAYANGSFPPPTIPQPPGVPPMTDIIEVPLGFQTAPIPITGTLHGHPIPVPDDILKPDDPEVSAVSIVDGGATIGGKKLGRTTIRGADFAQDVVVVPAIPDHIALDLSHLAFVKIPAAAGASVARAPFAACCAAIFMLLTMGPASSPVLATLTPDKAFPLIAEATMPAIVERASPEPLPTPTHKVYGVDFCLAPGTGKDVVAIECR